MTILTDVEGLDGLADYFKSFPQIAATAASQAINRTANRDGLKLLKDEMYKEVNFPKNYLNGDRLRVTRLATPTSLEARITGRKRATSLARFATSGIIGREGVRVQVQRGKTTVLKKAFLVRLNRGATKDEDNFNVGLAVRLGKGESLRNKHSAHQSWLVKPTVALLMGPSVDQVFRSVADTKGKKVLDLVAAEFLRNFNRLINK